MCKYLLYFLIVLTITSQSTALRCYACGSTENEVDQTCFEHPEEVKDGIITCNKKFCTSIRQEYLDPKDKVASLGRTCEDEPQHINEIIEDSTYRFYYVACQKDLCNGGSGKDTSGSNGPEGDTAGVGTLLVPGTGRSSVLVPNTLSIIAGMLFTFYVFYRR